jgi:hypothetical protein
MPDITRSNAHLIHRRVVSFEGVHITKMSNGTALFAIHVPLAGHVPSSSELWTSGLFVRVGGVLQQKKRGLNKELKFEQGVMNSQRSIKE